MRIAIVNWSRRRVAGVETYLNDLLPELTRRGHSTGFWSELDQPKNREQICLPENSPNWCVAELGLERALDELQQWNPDLIFAHSLINPRVESRILNFAPSVFFAHAYYGTCISQAKMFKSPNVKVCNRRFGWACLLHYYPHRCGGRNPMTMWREFRIQAARLKNLRRYESIITFSNHMRDEYLKHGFSPQRVHCLSHIIPRHEGSPVGSLQTTGGLDLQISRSEDELKPCRRIAFLGRMDFLKGGHLLIDALPQVAASLNCGLRVTFAGDGPQREAWQKRTAALELKGVKSEFVGWLQKSAIDQLLKECDLLVMPSLWPEPFGLAGLEAGLHSVPTAAFAVGGITDWLIDGVNGYTAASNPASAAGLAQAIIKCLNRPATHEALRQGANQIAHSFTLADQAQAILKIFHDIIGNSAVAANPRAFVVHR